MSLELTAYHEAGHAVMALLMGRLVPKVSIIPSQNRLDAVTMQKGRSKQVQDKLEADILILLAGMAAEGRKSGQYNLGEAKEDLQMVEKLALSRAGNPKQATMLIQKNSIKPNTFFHKKPTGLQLKKLLRNW